MKLRWKILTGTGILVLAAFAGWLATMGVGQKDGVAAYKKFLRDRGEKLEISELLPPTIAPESNGVELVEQAFSLLVPNDEESSNLIPAMRMVAPSKAIICSQQAEVRDFDFTNSWKNIMDIVEADRPATELLIQASTYPTINFPVDYQKGVDALLPNLAPFKQSALRLSTAALCDLHNGATGSAATNLCALVSLVQADHDERLLISQLVRMAMAAIATAGTWELLQSTNVADADLARLQVSWEKLEFIGAMEKSLEMERAVHLASLKKVRASNQELEREFFGGGPSSGSSGWPGSEDWLQQAKDYADNVKRSGADFMWRTSWSYSDELFFLHTSLTNLEMLRSLQTNTVFLPLYIRLLKATPASSLALTGTETRILKDVDLLDYREYLRSGMLDPLEILFRKLMAAETGKSVVITAIALKRFQLAHGCLPTQLSDLAPSFVPSVPLDPVDGQPLRYRLQTDGRYLLYSLGPNGVDDGGDPNSATATTSESFYWEDNRALDWVWPQPATEAEVKYYYEHPPK